MLSQLVPRAKVVLVACEGTILDAAVGSYTITPEADFSVKDDGVGESTSIESLLPVPAKRTVRLIFLKARSREEGGGVAYGWAPV